MQRNRELRNLIEIGLFAALIVLGITFFKIRLLGSMVHVGNALVILSSLLMGFKRGATASLLGLFIFDMLNGYASDVVFTLVEALIVLVVIGAVHRYVLKGRDTRQAIATIAVVGGLTKIVSRPFSIALKQVIIGANLETLTAVLYSKMPGTLITAVVTALLVPILYYPMKRVVERFHPIGE